jgi:riboflavin kinase / FMN adenylyltransferase
MIEINSLEDCSFKPEDQIVVALGFFDGIHQAHQCLIDTCINHAKARNGKSVLFTFQNHPSSVLNPDNQTPLITPYPLKRQILLSYDIDYVVAVQFDEKLCHTSAKYFTTDVLMKRLAAHEIIVGYNFHFGHNRQGSADMLKTLSINSFDEIVVIEQQFHDDAPVSSSRIRQSVIQGNLSEAANLLGRPYFFAGNVINGDGRGRSIGFPTANVNIDAQAIPPHGVYGVRVRLDHIDAAPLNGVMNIGNVPTFTDESHTTAEVHILDFNEDIYDRFIIVEFVELLRHEKKFSSKDELVNQIKLDIGTYKSHL